MRFEFATATRIVFGEGTAATLPELARSFWRAPNGGDRRLGRTRGGFGLGAFGRDMFVSGEPTVELVREGARRVLESRTCDVVISIGGGSAIDAGKAIAAIATNGGEPLDFLEVSRNGASDDGRAASVHCRANHGRDRQ